MTKTTFEQLEPDDRGPFDPGAWETVGISKDDGLVWWRHRIDPADALRWRRAGVLAPIDAVRWKIAGLRPDTVREWLAADIDAREAVAWSELGFTASDAREHKRAGRTPIKAYGRQHRTHPGPPLPRGHTQQPGMAGPPGRFIEAVRKRGDPRIIHSYMHRRWFDDEAIAWAMHGIDASEAVAWNELGVTPVEAQRQQAQGMSAMQTAKAWWQAGIPLDEVADWLGAGLSPQEAAEQRAKGVTSERAAILRGLRKTK